MPTSTRTCQHFTRLYCEHRQTRQQQDLQHYPQQPNMVVCEAFFLAFEDESGIHDSWELLKTFEDLWAALYEVALVARQPDQLPFDLEHCEHIEAALWACRNKPGFLFDKYYVLLELLSPTIAGIEPSPRDYSEALISA